MHLGNVVRAVERGFFHFFTLFPRPSPAPLTLAPPGIQTANPLDQTTSIRGSSKSLTEYEQCGRRSISSRNPLSRLEYSKSAAINTASRLVRYVMAGGFQKLAELAELPSTLVSAASEPQSATASAVVISEIRSCVRVRPHSNNQAGVTRMFGARRKTWGASVLYIARNIRVNLPVHGTPVLC